MLIILMYHQIIQGTDTLDFALFKKHIASLANNCNFVLPGNNLSTTKINICLTFDDAYYDFYYYLYPWLLAKCIPAVLGVPAGFIKENSKKHPTTRLQVAYPQGLSLDNQCFDPLCTWQEIIKMANSQLIMIASHGYQHADLSKKTTDSMTEIVSSKKLLEDKLQKQINTFIYPYGRFTREIQHKVSEHYQYALRIGSACNNNWHPTSKLLYRIDAKELLNCQDYFPRLKLQKWYIKYLLNRIRFK